MKQSLYDRFIANAHVCRPRCNAKRCCGRSGAIQGIDGARDPRCGPPPFTSSASRSFVDIIPIVTLLLAQLAATRHWRVEDDVIVSAWIIAVPEIARAARSRKVRPGFLNLRLKDQLVRRWRQTQEVEAGGAEHEGQVKSMRSTVKAGSPS